MDGLKSIVIIGCVLFFIVYTIGTLVLLGALICVGVYGIAKYFVNKSRRKVLEETVDITEETASYEAPQTYGIVQPVVSDFAVTPREEAQAYDL